MLPTCLVRRKQPSSSKRLPPPHTPRQLRKANRTHTPLKSKPGSCQAWLEWATFRTMTTKRCSWASADNPPLVEYHDREWGVPVHNDRKHFEVLALSGAQAGLSWWLVLKKREFMRTCRRLEW